MIYPRRPHHQGEKLQAASLKLGPGGGVLRAGRVFTLAGIVWTSSAGEDEGLLALEVFARKNHAFARQNLENDLLYIVFCHGIYSSTIVLSKNLLL